MDYLLRVNINFLVKTDSDYLLSGNSNFLVKTESDYLLRVTINFLVKIIFLSPLGLLLDIISEATDADHTQRQESQDDSSGKKFGKDRG